MITKLNYEFSAIPWQHPSPGGWCFVSLPKDVSEEIRAAFKFEEEGWGRLKTLAKLGNTEWKTAIWFDTKIGSYLLPLKAAIRKKENIELGKEIQVMVCL